MSRAPKRPRTSGYHDNTPLVTPTSAYSDVHYRSERVIGLGSAQRTARVNQTVIRPLEPWLDTAPWLPVDDPNFDLDPDASRYDQSVERDVMDEEPEGDGADAAARGNPTGSSGPPQRSTVAKRPNVVWKETYRQVYLDEECRWEGRGDFLAAESCPDCRARKQGPSPAEYRCLECYLPDLVCRSCCVKRHRVLPLHRIQHWTGKLFEAISLKEMGLRVQLNHASLACALPVPCHKSMRILHTNGIHDVAIDYCGCMKAEEHYIQLLRRRFYPATQLVIKTCATFELLQQLHITALTTKASTYDFYRALERMTANTGIDTPPTRYRTLFRMLMQWRHLKMLKRGGRAHDPAGVAATTVGELAILCPSCPRPDVNLPEGWENAPSEWKFLYLVILCMDANFRLKNQLVSNYSQDPGMGTGCAYMIERVPMEAYVLERAGEEDISTCVGLQALAKAYSKYCAGLRYTGVSAVSCGRSEMLLPAAVGNLQKGERYCNMDYTFGSALQSVAAALLVLISYDIACQWFVNLASRMDSHWPDEIKPKQKRKLIPAIPKLHHSMHERKGHEVYSLNYLPGVGNTDCECPERIWAPHNVLGNATKLQGPGTRHDYLDDHWGFWNWTKYSSMGKSLATKFRAAVSDRNIQAEGHRGLTAALDPEVIERWEAMCARWDSAPFPKAGIENPFEVDSDMLTETEVRKQLAEEEERRVASGGAILHSTSSSMFVIIGLELEEAQRRLQRLAKTTTAKSTARKKGGLTEQRNVLKSRIKAWELLLPIYMPGLLQFLTDTNNAGVSAEPASTSTKPEMATLWLPSRIPKARRGVVCLAGLPEIEERLRTVQCSDALNTVRHTLRLKSRMIGFKKQHLVGQRDGTRSRSVIDRVHGKARAAAAKYRAARDAKLELTGRGEWEDEFRVLLDSDIRGYQDPQRLKPRTGRRGVFEDDMVEALGRTSREAVSSDDLSLFNDARERRDGTGESRRTLSWIWTTRSTLTETHRSDEDDTVLRGEWAKSRARAARAREEVLLLKEEMRRVKAFLQWKATWWRERELRRSHVSAPLAEALAAYAEDQARIQEALAESFEKIWARALLMDNAEALEATEEIEDECGDDERLEAMDEEDPCERTDE